MFTIFLIILSVTGNPITSLERYNKAGEPPEALIVYDLRYAYETMTTVAGYEEIQLVSTLAGHVNRNEPSLYIILEDADSIWLSVFTSPGKWLSNTMLTNITSSAVEDLLPLFDFFFDGVVLYDPSVWCSSSVALTSAGAEDLLPIAFRPDDDNSLYSRLVLNNEYPILRDLMNMNWGNISGSVKRDAYVWATDEFIQTLKTDATHLNYYIDYYWAATQSTDDNGWAKATIPNLDFGISKRGFFFDLSVWADEAPIDEPSQPLGSDLLAFKYMLESAYNTTKNEQMITIHGFTPWAFKYVSPNGMHEGVETEWATVLITSAYNVIVDADACCIGNMANAALWQHFILGDRYIQPAPPSLQQLINKGYIIEDSINESISSYSVVGGRLYYMFYAGDYDSAAWLYSQFWSRWNDKDRGEVPIGWGIDPALSNRFPPIFSEVLTSLSMNDSIISGDSGAGYINPTMLYGQQRSNETNGIITESGIDLWVRLNKEFNNQFGISFTGFAISGDAPEPTSEDEMVYYNFSSNGVVDQGFPGMKAHLTLPNLPVITQTDISTNVDDAVNEIISYINSSNDNDDDEAPSWQMFRSVLTSPSYLNEVAQQANNQSNGKTIAVNPLELSYLMKLYFGGSNNNRVSYVNDTIPSSHVSSSHHYHYEVQSLQFTVSLRNDGWNILDALSHRLLVSTVAVQPVTHMGKTISRREIISKSYLSLGSVFKGSTRKKLIKAGFIAHSMDLTSHKELLNNNNSQMFELSSDLEIEGYLNVEIEYLLTSFQNYVLHFQKKQNFIVSDQKSVKENELNNSYVLTIEYQLVEVDSNENVVKTFEEYGIIPWKADLLVQYEWRYPSLKQN